MAIEVRNNDDAARYEAVLDGQVAGFAAYQLSGDRVVFTTPRSRHRPKARVSRAR